MLDIGFWELFVIGVIALIVLGPERLPGAARSVGRFVGKARRQAGALRDEFMRELDRDELQQLKKEAESLKREVEGASRSVTDSVRQVELEAREMEREAEAEKRSIEQSVAEVAEDIPPKPRGATDPTKSFKPADTPSEKTTES